MILLWLPSAPNHFFVLLSSCSCLSSFFVIFPVVRCLLACDTNGEWPYYDEDYHQCVAALPDQDVFVWYCDASGFVCHRVGKSELRCCCVGVLLFSFCLLILCVPWRKNGKDPKAKAPAREKSKKTSTLLCSDFILWELLHVFLSSLLFFCFHLGRASGFAFLLFPSHACFLCLLSCDFPCFCFCFCIFYLR